MSDEKPKCPECGTEVKSEGLCAACKNKVAREIEDRDKKLLKDLGNQNDGKKKKK